MSSHLSVGDAPTAVIHPRDVLRAFLKHPLRWIVPIVACATLGASYAFLKPATWEATQALIVRDEAVGKAIRPGKFSAVEEMKTAQETVLELIKSRSVLAAALKQVGPPADQAAPSDWPSERTVEALGDAIKLAPPKGAEFGKTEVFYLKVQAADRARAIALASALCQQLETHFDDLRFQKYQGVIDELTKTVSLAQAELNTSTASLGAVERGAGTDLAELRILNETPSNESGLRRQAGELETDLRTYRAQVNSNQELLNLLRGSIDDPGRLLASPSRLLESQPALRRLKDGLVDAQLRAAALLGNMEEAHPAVVAARGSEQEISRQLHDELSIAIKGLEVDLRLANQRVERLEEQRQNVQARLIHLATIRAEYSNLVTTTRHRGEILKTAQQELAEARAGQAAAHSASLITVIGSPEVGSRPVGPGKSILLLASIAGGFALAGGIMFLTVVPQPLRGRRHTDVVDSRCETEEPSKFVPTPTLAEPVVVVSTPAVEPLSQSPPLAGWTADRFSVEMAPLEPVVTTASSEQDDRALTTDDSESEEPLPAWTLEAEASPSVANWPVTHSSRPPVPAGSLSLRQALDRVFPGQSPKI